MARFYFKFQLQLGMFVSAGSDGFLQADFERVRSFGLNAVRLPFGYWVITEPRRFINPQPTSLGICFFFADFFIRSAWLIWTTSWIGILNSQ